MCSSKQIKELAECNAVYEFEKTVNMYGKEYIRYYYNKLAELNGSINSTCNCQHNSNPRDNEPCCRCDSKVSENDDTKNKVTSLEIIVRMIDNKPYYEIKYKKVGEDYYQVGYSSFNIDNVLKWRDECFELVHVKMTNADRIRNMSDEEMAKRIASSPNFDCADYCDSFSDGCAFRCNRKERELAVTLKWLRSEAE